MLSMVLVGEAHILDMDEDGEGQMDGLTDIGLIGDGADILGMARALVLGARITKVNV